MNPENKAQVRTELWTPKERLRHACAIRCTNIDRYTHKYSRTRVASCLQIPMRRWLCQTRWNTALIPRDMLPTVIVALRTSLTLNHVRVKRWKRQIKKGKKRGKKEKREACFQSAHAWITSQIDFCTHVGRALVKITAGTHARTFRLAQIAFALRAWKHVRQQPKYCAPVATFLCFLLLYDLWPPQFDIWALLECSVKCPLNARLLSRPQTRRL